MMQDTDTTARQEQQARQEQHEVNMRRGGMGRRGMIAAAAGAVAAFAVKGVADSAPVAANGPAWELPYDSGQVTASLPVASFHNIGINAGVDGSAKSYHGVTGTTAAPANSHFAGVYGSGNGVGTYGVLGWGLTDGTGVSGSTATGIGVLGASTGTGSGVSATNTGTGFGIFAEANNNHAIFGHLLSTTAGTAGVQGEGNGAGTYGIYGLNNGGTGVYGVGQGGIGVYGYSDGGPYPYGVLGQVGAAGGFALNGTATVSGSVGLGGTGYNGALAGQFVGNVTTYGNTYVTGSQTASGAKSAAVPHPDGTHRLLYCVEAPEAWFEDFGEGSVSGGKADVKLDPDFAAMVDTAKLHVFLTPHDEHHALHLTGRSATGFTVTAVPSTTGAAAGKRTSDANGTFTYRVVAKRKDVAAPRLAKFEVPQEIKTAVPALPSTSAPTAKPKA